MMIAFIISWFSVGLIIYILTCIKYGELPPVKLKDFLRVITLAPILIIMLLWEEL